MTKLFLIAHKVRGEPAFDIAIRMDCPHCHGKGIRDNWEEVPLKNNADGYHGAMNFAEGCHECDSLGYWWIIPTSGHRAYPYDSQPLSELIELADWPTMPPDLPDHYTTRAAPTRSLIDVLGLIHAPLARKAPLKRRF